MSIWRRVRLVDLCEAHVDCVNRTAPVVDEPTPFKMIRTTNVRGGFIDTNNVKYVTEETYSQWTRRLVPRRGDVVLTREAPLGEVGKVRTDEQIFLGQRLYHFRADPKLADGDFLMYALMGPDLQAQIRSFGSGSTVEHMRLPDIGKLELAVPDIKEQRRIAGLLSTYDELIENCDRRIRVLDEMAHALYREWFVLFRYPGYQKTPLVDSPLGRIPKGWRAATVADAASFLGRGIVPQYDDQGSSVVINQKCIRDLRLDLAPARRQSRLIPDDRRVRAGDVLVNSTGVGTLGRVAQVLESPGNCTVDTHVTIVRPDSEIDSTFLGLALFGLQPTFERKGVGATGQTELSRTAIGEVPLVLPPTERQRTFAEYARPIRDESFNLQKRAENLRKTRDLLLPRLLSGQLSVENAA